MPRGVRLGERLAGLERVLGGRGHVETALLVEQSPEVRPSRYSITMYGRARRR